MSFIKLIRKTPEEMEKRVVELTLENRALRGCLETAYRQVEEIKQYAEKHYFMGDIYICAATREILDQINYHLKGE